MIHVYDFREGTENYERMQNSSNNNNALEDAESFQINSLEKHEFTPDDVARIRKVGLR